MEKLTSAMKSVNDLNKTHGVTQRGGKKYTEVSVRIEAFRMAFGTELGIDTQVLVDDGKRVVVKAQITEGDRVIGAGMAEEIRGSSNVNKTSALENCETSAIGRALASLGLHGGTYASANEMAAVERKEQAQRERQAAPAPKPKAEPEPEDEDPFGLPPIEDAELFGVKNHEGNLFQKPVDDRDLAVKMVVELMKIYAKTEVNRAGEAVPCRERMTMIRQIKEHNTHITGGLSEADQAKFEDIYKKILARLGAQAKEQESAEG